MPLCLVSSGNIAALALRNSCSDRSEFTGTVGLCGRWMQTSLTRVEKLKILAKVWFDCMRCKWSGEVTATWSQNVVVEVLAVHERDCEDFRFSALVAWALL